MRSRCAHTLAISAVRTSRFTRFLVVPLTLVALFSGCYKYSWSQMEAPYPSELPDPVRVTHQVNVAGAGGDVRQDELTVVFESPRLAGDSLLGRVSPRDGRDYDLSLPESAILRLEVGEKRVAGPATGLAIAAVAVLTLAVGFLIFCDPDALVC